MTHQTLNKRHYTKSITKKHDTSSMTLEVWHKKYDTRSMTQEALNSKPITCRDLPEILANLKRHNLFLIMQYINKNIFYYL